MQIPEKSKVRIVWEDTPETYTKQLKSKIITHISEKYNVNKKNVHVVFKPIKLSSDGKKVEVDCTSMENIMDVNYQRQLFEQWLKLNDKKINIKQINKLDSIVNSELNIDLNEIRHKKWKLKEFHIDNLLCFSETNYVNFQSLNGLILIESTPKNMGGKTTFAIDAPKFLIFGKSTKAQTNEDFFNKHFPKRNKVSVKGILEIDGEDIIIERLLTRKETKKGDYKVTNTVTLAKLLPSGEQINLTGEQAKETTKNIKDTIGSEDDFDITILATTDTLDKLISSTPTESGKILTKFTGLEVLGLKETIAKKKLSEFKLKMKSNQYDIPTLKDEIKTHTENIKELNLTLKENETTLTQTKNKIETTNKERDEFLSMKRSIDKTLENLDLEKLKKEKKTITDKGITLKEDLSKVKTELKTLKDLKYDEHLYEKLTNQHNTITSNIQTKKNEIKRLEEVIENLKNSEICPTCNQKIKGVDNKKHITENENLIKNQQKEITKLTEKKETVNKEIESLNETKKKVDEKNRLELKHDRIEVDMSALRNDLKDLNFKQTRYNENIETIEHNKKLDIKIEKIKTDITVLETKKENLLQGIEQNKSSIKDNEKDIEIKNKLIEEIKVELKVKEVYDIYIQMLGKKGISKIVLKSILPIINSELTRLLDDVCDFDVELTINDKNDVEFLMIRDDVEKPVKSCSGLEKTLSSIAIRGVLGKMSVLPTPNFVVFDEVLDKVADENLDNVRLLFDKLKQMYDIIMLVSFREEVRDWSDNIVSINKTNNESKILVI